MTIQEEIREGMARIICCFAKGNKSCAECEYNTPDTPFPDCFPDIREDTDQLLTYLHSQGVVIKVERELPKNPWSGWKSILDPTILGMNKKRAEAYKMAQDDMAGYEAVEPLIKDDK